MKVNLKITMLFILMMSIFAVYANAAVLNIELRSSVTDVKEEENFTVTVDWHDPMQAADFSVLYDAEKVELVECKDIDGLYNNKSGEAEIFWFSMDETEKTSITLEFKAKKTGKAEISTRVNQGFADKNIVEPDDYKTSNISINVKSKNELLFTILTIAVVIIVAIVLIRVYNLKKSNGKKKSHHSK